MAILVTSILHLDDCLPEILAVQHADKSIEHILKAFGHGLMIMKLAFADQLQIMLDSLVPAI